MGSVSAFIRILMFAGLTLPLMPLQFAFLLGWRRMASALPHYYHRAAGRLLGFRVTVTGALPERGACLVVSNHVSWIDILVLSRIGHVSFVAKREIAGWPLFGWLAKLQRTVFVDRDRRHATGRSRNELAERLSRGERIVLFPEGTSHDGASVLPFKSSFFAAAVEGVAIVPVTLVYREHWGLPLTRRTRPHFAWYADMPLMRHLWQALQSVPVGIDVIIHPPLKERLDRKQAANTSERLIRETLARALHGRLK
jgi:lyso-ornithine lipid O-acyltransferase